jgi:diguanylate cyclase (GGDEF)-like protein
MMVSGRLPKTDYETKQYVHQANLVYIGTIVSVPFVLPIYWMMGNMVVFALNIIIFVVTFFVIWLNTRRKHALASALFITLVSVTSFMALIAYGSGVGFNLYFFNMAVLIIFSKWSPLAKTSGVLTEIALIIGAYVHALAFDPLTVAPQSLLTIMFVVNVVLNMFGIVNSSRFHMNIARKANTLLGVMATTDELSGLTNRMTLNWTMAEINPTTSPSTDALAVMMMDIDHFKNVNDTYGHVCGDAVIRQFSRILKSHGTEDDLIARYGGEEFTFVMFDDDVKDALIRAERIRIAVKDHVFVWNNVKLSLTVSIGLAIKTEGRTCTNEEILTRADKLLYDAKDSGRNRVVTETK